MFRPAGGIGYDELRRRAVAFEAFRARLVAAGLEDIITLKEEADRPQDRQDVVILRDPIRRRDAGDLPEP